jgi:hypothetical protein
MTQAAAHHANAEARWLAVRSAAAYHLRRMCPRAVADLLGVSIRRVTELRRVMRAGAK